MPGLRAYGAPILELFKDGTLTADGTEQTIVEMIIMGSLEGWIDLANMASGDTIIITQYAKVKSGGTYRRYASATYVGAQTDPALFVTRVPSRYGVKLTLQQSAGTYRTFDYNFFRRR